ncbi:hypothetical protein [Synechococcus sp. MU1611]|uniref:hypothetical protein n=1 Tax=Synechococcus sp. MU1611 TaxID=2508345 RepID=UPI001CF91852|nr:hypothetical protein [Synechococcus sp. MU1611]MCB4411672.1 hypothetical protein [Synechococcus sp. MU1611]
MVTEEQLAALDLTLWLGSTERAAEVEFSNQSTISRRHHKVLRQFGIELKRTKRELEVSGDLQLLDLERQVHQMARLKRRLGLRLQAPFWLQNSPGVVPPEGWTMNPQRVDLNCTDPVTLLREHVLDACLATPTQIPDNRDDLFILKLHNRPIELTLLNRNNQSESELADSFQWSLERGNLQLKLMPFLPASCRERSQEWFEELLTINQPERNKTMTLRPSRHSGQSFHMAYLTPEMRVAQPLPWLVDQNFEPYIYTEHLVVLAQHANEPAMLALIESLQQQIGQ